MSDITRFLLATTNPGKLREITAVISDPSVEIITLTQLKAPIIEPVEDGDTFEANAALKARHYAAASGLPTVADDSGLEVDAIDGAPGVRSARYAGVEGDRETRDLANNRKLLEALDGVPVERRTARFVCAMAIATPPGMHFADLSESSVITVRGTLEGRVLLSREAADGSHPERGRGRHGFGYDPLFFVPDLGRTTAELEPAEKNRISHRGDASRRMWLRIQQLLASGKG
jgi:XTP/dITP diphosphohydrolase